MNKKIIKTIHVDATDRHDVFITKLNEAINTLQDENLEVDVQYQCTRSGNYCVKYSALLIGFY